MRMSAVVAHVRVDASIAFVFDVLDGPWVRARFQPVVGHRRARIRRIMGIMTAIVVACIM